ncbi:MAG: RidA family protein [Spirochaetaceae bacterium]|jgi:2-iminobutanoate/2-iminopropanoate deaminase|nr:RidA family protein [Spirochaetaceae bacterium]
MNIIQTDAAPAAIGPYSQGFSVGNLIWTSGQIPLNPKTGGIVDGGITGQAEQCIQNLKAVLEAAGSSLTKVIKTTCFLADMDDFAAFNDVYARHFTGRPARSCVAVKTLPKNVLCEIEAVAEK